MNIKIIIPLLLATTTLVWSQDCCEAEEIATYDCGGLGCYIPQCTDDCEWEPMQCWISTGYCWCVDENGEEIDGTSMPSWQGTPDCEDFSDECTDGEVDNSNPCNPMECWEGEWIEIIIDCAEDWGIPCEGGVYIPPPEGVCCSECVTFGDVNFDSDVNILDIVAILGFIIGTDTPSISEYLVADYNQDESINVLDIVALVSLIINPTDDPEFPEECYLEPNTGPCFGYVPMYYFNQDTQSCETFIWGGCAGVVPFESYQECVDVCE